MLCVVSFYIGKIKKQIKTKQTKTQKNALYKINDTFKCNIMKNLNNEIPLENQALDLMKKPVCMMSGEELFMLKAGALDGAIISKIGHRYVFDAEHARQLADNYQKAQREQRETQ